MNRPRRTPGLRSCRPNSRAVTDCATGSGGKASAANSSATALSAARAPNALRQPATSPIQAPSGTPSTDATATPPKITAVAMPTAAGGTSRPARPPATAQMPPMQMPTRTRAARNPHRCGASALPRLAPASSSNRPHRMRRRSTPRAPITTSGAHRAARMPGTTISQPTRPVDTPRLAAMGGSKPTGSISVVTTQNVARPAADTPAQAAGGWPAAVGGRGSRAILRVMEDLSPEGTRKTPSEAGA
ncbi:Uncharacterised protein [Achromobacter ruhlandii]|nr:Uncharacterised protein [Achromobacter ruhlandii]